MSVRVRFTQITAVASLTAALTSCGPTGPKLYPVTGQVLFEGQPAVGASVVFHPVNSTPEGRMSGGSTDKDGKYALRTFPYGEGAPEGEYTVAITWFETVAQAKEDQESADPKSRIPVKYADAAKSGFVASVKPGTNVIEPFKLTKDR